MEGNFSVPDGVLEYQVELPVTQVAGADVPQAMPLRFLLMAGRAMAPEGYELDELHAPQGWEQSVGAFQFYADAFLAAGNFPSPDYWWHIVDLKTMRIVFRHDDTARVTH